MRHRSWIVRQRSESPASSKFSAAMRKRAYRPAPEALDDRVLLAAALAPIANLFLPAQQGYALPLDGSGTTDPQTFSITRIGGSPDIVGSIAQGPFWTMDVSYTDPNDASNDFSGPMVFQLFQSTTVNGKAIPLTTNTVSHIEEFTDDGYYTTPTSDGLSPTKLFTRIAPLGPLGSNYIAQGGEPTSIGTGGHSYQPNTPFRNEEFQQLAFTGTDQIAMANANNTNPLSGPIVPFTTPTNDTQFFITTSNLNSYLGCDYSIFGQMVSGQSILGKMIEVPTRGLPLDQPDYNLSITHVSLASTNPNGVALIDTTQAKPGESAIFQVTATDPTDGTSVRHDFAVTVGAYGGPTHPIIDFKPFANPVSASVSEGRTATVRLDGQSGYPNARTPGTLTYSLLSKPRHGRISHFDASAGTFDFTPKPGFTGTVSFQYLVRDTGPESPFGPGPGGGLGTTTSDPATVTIMVTRRVRKHPRDVRLIGATPVMLTSLARRIGHDHRASVPKGLAADRAASARALPAGR